MLSSTISARRPGPLGADPTSAVHSGRSIEKWNVEPAPGVLSAQIIPFIISTSRRAMASVTSFSRVPLRPLAPGSSPPCPASTAIMMVRPDFAAGAFGGFCAGAIYAGAPSVQCADASAVAVPGRTRYDMPS